MNNMTIPPANLSRILALSVALAIFGFAPDSRAATYHWGGGTANIAGTGTPVGGTGTWNATIQNWTLNDYSGSGSSYLAWPGAGNDAVFGGTAGTVTMVNQTVGNLAVETSGYIFTIGGNITLTLGSFSGAQLANSTFQATSGSRTLVFSGSGATTYSGALRNGGGTLIFRLGSNRELSLTGTNNDYTGATQIYAGQLNISSIANGGVNSTIGASTSAAANIALGNSTLGAALNYVGSGGSTDRLFSLLGNTVGVNHKILNNGSGALSFTNTGAMVHAGTADQARTFTLGGTNTDNNIFAVQLTNNGSGALSFIKADAGRWIMTGDNTYTGNTTVAGGTLLINGSTAANSLVTVESGAVLGGSGLIGGNTTIKSGATLAPGTSPGVLSFGSDLTLEGNVIMELNGLVRGTGYDGIDVAGALAYGGALSLSFGTTFANGSSFSLFNFGSASGSFDTITLTGSYIGSLVNSGGVWSGSIGGQDFEFLQADGTFNVVPEPSTVALLVLTGVGLIFSRCRLRRSSGSKQP
jgi:autotransporter-associated beta strand protein